MVKLLNFEVQSQGRPSARPDRLVFPTLHCTASAVRPRLPIGSRRPLQGCLQGRAVMTAVSIRRLFRILTATAVLAVVVLAGRSAAPADDFPDQLVSRPLPPAPEANPLRVGGEVRTGARERRRFDLPNGVILLVNENTTIQRTEVNRLRVTAGEILVDVGSVATVDLHITTPKRELTARDPRLAVRVADAGTTILVERGSASVEGVGAVAAGQQLRPGDDKPVPAGDAAASLAWAADLMEGRPRAAQRVRRGQPRRRRSRRPRGEIEPAQVPRRCLRRGRLRPHHHRPDLFQPYARSGWRARSTSRCRRTPRCRGWPCTWTATSWTAAWWTAITAATYTRPPSIAKGIRRCSNGWTAARSRCASSRWKPGRKSGCILSYTQELPSRYGRLPTASRPATASAASATGRSTPASRTAPASPGTARRTPCKAAQDGDDLALDGAEKDVKLDRDVVVELTDPAAAGAGRALRRRRSRTERNTSRPAGGRICRARSNGSGATGSSCSSRPATAIRCWRGRRWRWCAGLLGDRRAGRHASVLAAGTRASSPAKRAAAGPTSGEFGADGAIDFLQKAPSGRRPRPRAALAAVEPTSEGRRKIPIWSTSAAASPHGRAPHDELLKHLPPGTRLRRRRRRPALERGFMKAAAERTGG